MRLHPQAHSTNALEGQSPCHRYSRRWDVRELLESLGSRSDKDWNLTGFWLALVQLLGVGLRGQFQSVLSLNEPQW